MKMRLSLPKFHFFKSSQFKNLLLSIFSGLLLAAVTIAPIVFMAWLVFFTDTFVIQAITIVDARPHTEEAVRQIIKPTINTNIFFASTDRLEYTINKEIPQINNIYITRTLPNTLKVVVQEKTPKMLLVSGGKYYFVDAQGIAYEEATLDTLPGVVLPTVKNNDHTADLQVGNPAVTENFVNFLSIIQEELKEITGSEIVEIRIPSLAAREVHFALSNNWEILFDITRDAEIQLNILKKVLATTVSAEEQEKLEYVDLRISNRVYYKVR